LMVYSVYLFICGLVVGVVEARARIDGLFSLFVYMRVSCGGG